MIMIIITTETPCLPKAGQQGRCEGAAPLPIIMYNCFPAPGCGINDPHEMWPVSRGGQSSSGGSCGALAELFRIITVA